MVSLWSGATVAMASTNCSTLLPMYRTMPVSVFSDTDILSEKSNLNDNSIAHCDVIRAGGIANSRKEDLVSSGQIWILYVVYFCTENKAVGVMKPGHVFTIEPMICEGKRQSIKFFTWILKSYRMFKNCFLQVAGRTRRGQMVGRQSLAMESARPSSNTRSSCRRPAAKSSRVD